MECIKSTGVRIVQIGGCDIEIDSFNLKLKTKFEFSFSLSFITLLFSRNRLFNFNRLLSPELLPVSLISSSTGMLIARSGEDVDFLIALRKQ